MSSLVDTLLSLPSMAPAMQKSVIINPSLHHALAQNHSTNLEKLEGTMQHKDKAEKTK